MSLSTQSTQLEPEAIAEIARQLRRKLVKLSHQSGAAHLASSLSCVDITAAAYWGVLSVDPENPDDPDRDRFILSKGHAATTLYAALTLRGFSPEHILDTFGDDGSILAEHPGPQCIPGVEAATGSLGHGLPIGNGIALSAKLNEKGYRVFVLMSDGECNEGSVWEAAMFAPAYGLDNVCAIIDYNKWQATGRSDEVLQLSPLADKWRAFGWNVHEADGHDIGALLELLRKVPDGTGKPVAIIAHTVKGKGVSFMEDENNWHYRVPNDDELEAALKELGES